MIKTKFALVAALLIGSSVAIVADASAATKHRATAAEWQTAPVSLPYSYRSNMSSRYSGAFRTDSAPITGGGY